MMFLNIKPIPSGPELGIRPCNNTSPSTEQFNFIKSYFESKMNTTTTDSGLDLPLPYDVTIPAKTIGFKLPLGISAQPKFTDDKPRGYTLYPRSSTGSKTPLRLSNGTGIIDFDYRGEITACVDNISNEDYYAKQGQRLFQLCSYDLSPIQFIVTDEINTTSRQSGGYGSTGA
uniref:dUTP diphosphatase n=1 Tax=viral metagenome TaxID=1070528 RepID=A0A6C0AUS7_9ZZZZ